jgi:hypothetical protein
MEEEFITEYKQYFAEYKDILNNCYIQHSKYKDLCLDLFSVRRSIDIASQNPNIIKKDNDGNTFVDNLIELYKHINSKYYELDLDQVGLERSVKRMFINKNITKNLRDKYKKYIDDFKNNEYSDDDDFDYVIKNE